MKKKYKTKPGNRLNALVYYYKNKDAIRAKDNAFRADPKNKKTLQLRDKKIRDRPHNKVYQRNYWRNYRANEAAQVKIDARAKANEIKIPKGFKCDCGNLATDRHHTDYNKPYEIIFCCKKCHMILDKERRQKLK